MREVDMKIGNFQKVFNPMNLYNRKRKKTQNYYFYNLFTFEVLKKISDNFIICKLSQCLHLKEYRNKTLLNIMIISNFVQL